jgi:hypothetical protein
VQQLALTLAPAGEAPSLAQALTDILDPEPTP